MLAQVKGIKDPTPKKTEEAMNEDRESNFVVCTYPSYKRDKVLRITEEFSCITVLGERLDCFFWQWLSW